METRTYSCESKNGMSIMLFKSSVLRVLFFAPASVLCGPGVLGGHTEQSDRRHQHERTLVQISLLAVCQCQRLEPGHRWPLFRHVAHVFLGHSSNWKRRCVVNMFHRAAFFLYIYLCCNLSVVLCWCSVQFAVCSVLGVIRDVITMALWVSPGLTFHVDDDWQSRTLTFIRSLMTMLTFYLQRYFSTNYYQVYWIALAC